MKLIKIKEENEGVISVSLYKLLLDIDKFISSSNFFLYELEATGSKNIDYFLGVFSDEINNSDIGVPIKWNDLLHKTSQIDQVINIILVGNLEKKVNDKYLVEHGWKNKKEIVIEMVDGDCWEIYSSNLELVTYLKNKYLNVEVLSYL